MAQSYFTKKTFKNYKYEELTVSKPKKKPHHYKYNFTTINKNYKGDYPIYSISPEGIRGASCLVPVINKQTKKIIDTRLIYIHRYDAAKFLGLIKKDYNHPYTNMTTNDYIVRWDRLFGHLKKVEEEFLKWEGRGLGFFENNESSSNSRPSDIELRIPEYIDTQVIYIIAGGLQNPVASEFRFNLIQNVIPFFVANANEELIRRTRIVGRVSRLEEFMKNQ